MPNINYGAIPSKIDLRDYQIKSEGITVDEFFLENLPEVKNQLFVGSCVAHVLSSILEWFNQEEIGEHRELSTGFIYGMQGVEFSRMAEGMYLRDACKIIQKYGDCLFGTFPYNIMMPECYNLLTERLSSDLLDEAKVGRIQSYARCQTDDDIKHALIHYGPVAVSIKWYDEYKLTDNGVVEFDTSSDFGNHAVMIYGFNRDGWLCQNSWGRIWGNGGRFVLPFSYGFNEAWSFVDEINDDIYRPKRGRALDVLYKVINFAANVSKVVVDWFKEINKRNF